MSVRKRRSSAFTCLQMWLNDVRLSAASFHSQTTSFFSQLELTNMCETQNDLTGFHLFFIIVAICFGLTRVLNGVAQEISKSTSESNQKCCISKCDLNGALIWHRQLFDHLVCVLFKPQTEHFNRLSLLNGSGNENIASNKMDWKFVPSHLRDFLPAGSVAVVILRALIFHVTHIVVLEPKD